ncbi:alpha/beta fold hydrolase [Streptomyces herbicida]|uniref:alpha/beta fold hydrolase n=1 Tax=Streptomyces herbicida TaxID=3065675 RepID=UPI00292E5BE7|nr:alpha/beta hydrolase [Streptomyces sp. NEAU-HV9]
MPVSRINGIDLSYDEYGSGEPVLLIAGTGAPGRIWRTHQVPALTAAGFRVITVDNRGVAPSDLCEEGFTLADMVADTAGLVEFLGAGPCRVVGFSMGAILVQELLLVRPDLVRQAVLMATRGRSDTLSRAMTEAELEVLDSKAGLPPRYEALVRVMQGFSPRTLRDEATVRDWLDIFEMSPLSSSVSRSQLEIDILPDRLSSYRNIGADCMVLAFADDLLTPPHLCREVADSIPGSTYREIPGCGHYGFIERPAEVNSALAEFFRGIRN